MHPDFLSPQLSERQLQGWMSYFEIEPWGRYADDYMTALGAWLLMDKKTRQRIDPDVFMPRWCPKDPPTPEEYKAKAKALIARASAAAIRRNKR